MTTLTCSDSSCTEWSSSIGADIYIRHDGNTNIGVLREHLLAVGEAEEQVRVATEQLKDLLTSVQPLHLMDR